MCTLQQRPIVGAGSGNDIRWRNAPGHHGTIGQGRPLVSNHTHLVTSGGNNGYWTGYDNHSMQPRGDGRRFTGVGTAPFSDPVHYVDGGHRIPSPRATQNHGGNINQAGEACIGLQSVQPPTINDLIGSLNISNQPPNQPSVTSTYCRVTGIADHDEDSDGSDDDSQTHPNKYPVEIEEHNSKFCGHSRQHSRSGTKIKQRVVTINDPITLEPTEHTQHIKSYQKHLVRICRCGRYPQMDGALTHGRSNDCDGYEIHYNQKCKWKAYDDFKTGKRVLIRLCKCYKPSL